MHNIILLLHHTVAVWVRYILLYHSWSYGANTGYVPPCTGTFLKVQVRTKKHKTLFTRAITWLRGPAKYVHAVWSNLPQSPKTGLISLHFPGRFQIWKLLRYSIVCFSSCLAATVPNTNQPTNITCIASTWKSHTRMSHHMHVQDTKISPDLWSCMLPAPPLYPLLWYQGLRGL